MEKRAILAVGLMLALLVVYQTFFLPHSGPPPPEKPAAPTEKPDVPTAPQAGPPTVAPVAPPTPGPETPRPPQKLVSVEAPLYHGRVSSEGGKLQEWTLKYRGEKPLVVLGEQGPRGLVVVPHGAIGAASQIDRGAGPTSTGVAPLPMTMSPDALTLDAGRPTGEFVLTGQTTGLRVTHTLGFRADSFGIDARIRIENTSASPITVTVALPWRSRERWPEKSERFLGQHPTEIVWAPRTGHVERIEDLTAVGNVATDGQWIGIGSVPYLAALVPKAGGFQLVAVSDPKPAAKDTPGIPEGYVTIEVRATPTIAPGQTWEGDVLTYVGPKEYERLRALGLEGAINFGGFPIPRKYGGLPMEWLGVPILLLLQWVYHYVGNYGIAIILLTIVSKALFYPLTVKSMRSMKAMQALSPHINALRNKYKSDPQRLQRETMELYRKHGVNPMGGCLPMVAQVPIFYALYLALSVSVELQNATFICFGHLFGVDLWICDLATHDPTYVLPILMGITMFVQQRMTPTAGDPRQAKMMLVMPFVFTFMFLNLPSGLVLYWTVSNILQILQQYYMDRPKRQGAGREVKDVSRA
jgi:YidC/Oxa1 family membrane protein insertase